MEPQIFISYSRKDSAFVRRMVDDLSSRGVDIWLDQRDIKAGERWDTSVQNALRDSDYFMVVLSPESVASENVMDEIAYAVSKTKHVFPILYRDCDIPYRLARVQYVDFRGSYETGLERLLEEIRLAPAPGEQAVLPPEKDTSISTATRAADQQAPYSQPDGDGTISAHMTKASLPSWVWIAGGIAGVAILFLLFLMIRGNLPSIGSTPGITPEAKLVVWTDTPPPSPTTTTIPTDTSAPPSPTSASTAETPASTTAIPSPISQPIPSVSEVRFCDRPCTEAGAQPVSSYPVRTKIIYLTMYYDSFYSGMPYSRTWTNNGQEWIHVDCTWRGTESGTKNLRLFDTGGLRSGLWVMKMVSEGEVISQAEVLVEGSFDYWSPAGYQPCPDF